MYQPLAPCLKCSRHVKISDAVCPFCNAALGEAHAKGVVPGAPSRLSRAAAMAFTASLSVSGCGGIASAVDGADAADTAPNDSGSVVEAYGAPPRDSGPTDGSDASEVGDGGKDATDDVSIQPAYGLPGDGG